VPKEREPNNCTIGGSLIGDTQGDLAGSTMCARRSAVISMPYRRKVSEHPRVEHAQHYLA